MIVTFLGSGTSQGVPLIGCKCPVCRSLDYRNNRLRSSVHILTQGKSLVIDTGPDFRQQMLQNRVASLDAVLYTHSHKDHISGMDELRAFNFLQKHNIPLYGSGALFAQLKKEFSYAFEEFKYPGVPLVDTIEIFNEPFWVDKIQIVPIQVMHYKMPVFGFRINDFTYITDASYISDAELDKIRGSEVVVLNGLQYEPHISHFTLPQALKVLENIKPKRAYITHISHRLGLHEQVEATLPDYVRLAYDGLKIQL